MPPIVEIGENRTPLRLLPPPGISPRLALDAFARFPEVRSAQPNRSDEVTRTVRDPFRSL